MNAEQIQTAIDQLARPDAVSQYIVRTGTDSTGDPAAWIFVVINDAEVEALWPDWDGLRENIRKAVEAVAGTEVMVYIRMWSASELEEQRRASS